MKNLEPNQVILRAGALAYGGSFVCDLVQGPAEWKGKKFFVRGVVPEELIEAKVTVDHKSYAEAELVEVQESSPLRVVPECEYFGSCGGCDLQYMSIEAQRNAKLQMVESALSKHAGGVPINGMTLIGRDLPAFAYRRRITLHVSEAGDIGFYRQSSREVVPISKCLLASDPINRTLAELNKVCMEIAQCVSQVQIDQHADKVFIVFVLRENGNWQESLLSVVKDIFPDMVLTLKRRKVYYQENFREVTDSIPAGHFSQVNDEANKLLVARVLSAVVAKELTEFYGGSGNFSFPLAQAGKFVEVVEIDEALVKYGAEVAAKLGIGERVRFVHSSAETFLKRNRPKDAVLLDPPRSGALEVVKKLPENVKQVVYVSCNLPSLCRDIKVLKGKGFSLLSTEVLDMFPQTHHVETISTLEKLDG